MAGVNIDRNKVRDMVDRLALRGLDRAGKAMVGIVRDRLAVAGGGVPSAPGESPRKQTGELQASVGYAVDLRARTVTVTVDHPAALALEYGTRIMAPRPYLRPALHEYRDRFGDRPLQPTLPGTGS